MANVGDVQAITIGEGTVRMRGPGGGKKPRAPADPNGRSARFERWRALSLTSVYVLFGLHIAHWKLRGTTLAPLELNEVMYTLEAGVITAGFLLMATLVVGSAIFGRFFCSWACHILALEDLAAWILRKLRIRVQPVRSRVLMLVPPIALFYMFVWPQLVRWFEGEPLPRWRVLTDADGWASFVTQDFWRNLPDPWIALFTFAVCGFAMVYVLGSRSFCFYGCPYGALFALADRFAPGRIKLTGDCLQCATCTAVCTSHVRVHEEVARYGKVVDSNCMKDLDCVASCPEGALSYGFTRPAPLASFARTGRRGMPAAFSATEDVVMAVSFMTTLLVSRGLYTAVPFLTALGLAAIVSYLSVVGLRLGERSDVRLIRARLKQKGTLTSAGRWFVAGAVLFGIFFAHSAFIRYHEFRGQRAFEQVKALVEQPGAQVPPVLHYDATRHLSIARHWGLFRPLDRDHQLASLYLKSDTPEAARPYLERILRHQPNDVDSRLALARVQASAGRFDEALQEAERALDELRLAAVDPSSDAPAAIDEARVHELVGTIHLANQDPERASRAFLAVLDREPQNPSAHASLAELLAADGRYSEAAEHFRSAIATQPGSAQLQFNLATVLSATGDDRGAIEAFRASLELEPDDADALNHLGFLLIRQGEPEKAEAQLTRAVALRPDFAHAEFNLGGAYEQLGDLERAREHFRNAARLDPQFARYLGSAIE